MLKSLYLFLLVLFVSCRIDHKMSYKIKVTYTDKSTEVIEGQKVVPMVERVNTLDVAMSRSDGTVCACVTNGVWCKEVIVCDIIRMEIISKKETF